MVIVSPLRIGLFPFQMAVSWLINGDDPIYLLNGMILQVVGGLNQPVWKISVKLDHFPRDRGENKKIFETST